MLASCFWLFSGVSQEKKKPAEKVEEKPKVVAKAKAKGRPPVGEKEAPISLASPIRSLKKEGFQVDLPAAVVLSDGMTVIAHTEWDGTADALHLVGVPSEEGPLEVLATVVEEAVLHAPALAVDHEDRVWIFWGETDTDDDTVDLKVCSWTREGGVTETELLADSDAAEAFVDAGTDSEGRIWAAWQSLRAGEGDVFARFRSAKGEWSEEIPVADQEGGDWAPDLAFDGEGNAWVLYDSSRGNEFNLYLAKVSTDGQVEEFPIGHSEAYEARGSIVATADGTGFWLSAERGKPRWGLDSRGHGNATGINAGKTVLFGRFEIATGEFSEAPMGPAGEAGSPINVPVVGVGRDGNPWVAYRYYTGGIWRIGLSCYRQDSKTWSSRRRLERSSFGQDRKLVFLSPSGKEGDIQVCWPSDERVNKTHLESGVFLATLASAAKADPAKPPVEKPTREPVFAKSQSTPERPAYERHEWEVSGKSYGLFWGDFHRHTDISNCRTGFDGCIVDHFRYAYDLAKIDYLGTSDHTDIAKKYDPYEWWHNQRMHDALHSPGRFNTMYVYEREQRWPWGHRNVVFADRGGPVVYIKRATYRNSPWQSVFPVKPGVGEILPYELWDILENYGKPVAVISHTGASGMGTDWGKYERIGYASENVIEIFQGARVSYEGEGAPQPTAGLKPGEKYTINGDGVANKSVPPGPILDFGKYRTGTYQSALEMGHKLGVFASSDHIAQHTSYGGVYCEEFTREGIIEALDQRRTIAATDKIYLNFTCNDKPLGSILETEGDPKLWFRVDGTAPIRRITVVRNEEDWKTFGPFEKTTFEKELFDGAMLEGENRYYIRVEQADGNMAWSSPVWVTRK